MKFVKFKELFGDKTVYLPYNKKGEENNVSKQEPWSILRIDQNRASVALIITTPHWGINTCTHEINQTPPNQ